jgi:hypothetical protein
VKTPLHPFTSKSSTVRDTRPVPTCGDQVLRMGRCQGHGHEHAHLRYVDAQPTLLRMINERERRDPASGALLRRPESPLLNTSLVMADYRPSVPSSWLYLLPFTHWPASRSVRSRPFRDGAVSPVATTKAAAPAPIVPRSTLASDDHVSLLSPSKALAK